MRYFLVILFIGFLFMGCSDCLKTTKIISDSRPSWLQKAGIEYKGKNTAIGCAYRHIDGEYEQKKSAIKKAIDTLVLHKEVSVKNITYRTLSNGEVMIDSQVSLHESDNINIQTKLLDSYVKNNGDICVWIAEI